MLQFGGTLAGTSAQISLGYTPRRRNLYAPPLQNPVKQQNKPIDLTSGLEDMKGISSDVNLIYQKNKQLQEEFNNLSEMDVAAQTDKFLRLTAELNKWNNSSVVNELRNLEEEYNVAQESMKANESSGAFATQGSQVLTVDSEGKINTMHWSLLAKNKENYRPITATEALSIREGDERYAMNRSIIESVRRTIGIPAINSKLNAQIKSLGEYEETTKTFQEISKFGSDYQGFIKWSKGNNSAQVKSLDHAWENALDEDMRTQLIMQAMTHYPALEDPNEIHKAAKFIMSSVFTKTLKSSSVYEEDIPTGQLGSGGSSARMKEIGAWAKAAAGYTKPTQFEYTWGEENLSILGYKVGRWTKDNHRTLVLNESAQAASDLTQVYNARGEKIDGDLLDRAVIAEGSTPHVVWLPTDRTGKPLISPENLSKLNKFTEVAQSQGEVTQASLDKAAKETGIEAATYKQFASYNVVTSRKPSTFGNDDPTFKEIDGKSQSARIYRNVIGTETNLKTERGFLLSDDDVGRMVLFAPLSDVSNLLDTDQGIRSSFMGVQHEEVHAGDISPVGKQNTYDEEVY